MKYTLKQGDVISVKGDLCPAVVVSNDYFNARSNIIIVCPITNTDKKYPMHIPLNNTISTGFILCDHVKSVDLSAREAVYIEKLPDDILESVIERITAVITK